VRRHLTTWVWYEDRLSSLPSAVILGIACFSFAGLTLLGFVGIEFLDDLAYLVGENDVRSLIIVADLCVASGAAIWVLSCCLGALAHRVMLRLRGL
jgi:hypothetical protein